MERAALTNTIIRRINETGAKVTSITFNGPRMNILMAIDLGADFENNKPFFTELHKIQQSKNINLDNKLSVKREVGRR